MKKKKLTLKKVTITDLTPKEASGIVGGASWDDTGCLTCGDGCSVSCNCSDSVCSGCGCGSNASQCSCYCY
jgi:hypothetical protein